MEKKYIVIKKTLPIMLVAAFLLAACVQPVSTSDNTTDQADPTPVEKAQDTPVVEEPGELEAYDPGVETEEVQPSPTSEPECRVEDPQKVGYSVLGPPDEDDWTRGPDDGYVTIIEYGDFQ